MRNLFLSLILLTSGKLFAQQYVPFPTDSARWNCSFWAYQWFCPTVPPHDYEYNICGDTLIGPTVYHKICAVGWSGDTNCLGVPDGYMGCIREDSSRRVYFRPAWLGADTLLYDFNLQVGDTMKSYQNPCLDPITAIDSVLIGSAYRKRYFIQGSMSCSGFSVYIIEGIGSTGGLLEPYGQYMAHNILDCFSHNGQSLYPYTNAPCTPLVQSTDQQTSAPKWNAMPNPSASAVTLTSSGLKQGANYSVVLWNVAGERVSVQQCTSDNGSITIERNGVAEGVYFAEIMSNEQTIGHVEIIFL